MPRQRQFLYDEDLPPRDVSYGVKTRADILDFLTDEYLLGPHFTGPSWNRWRAVLRAAFALPMSRRDRTLFAEVSGDRNPPRRPVRELVCAVGRGGGKDSIAAALAVYIAVTADFTMLRPGERGSIMCLATDRDQAKIAFGYIKAHFEQTLLLKGLVERIGDDFIQLRNKAEIVVQTNNTRSPRGRTIACAIFDEAAFWLGVDYAHPDTEVDAAVSPGLMRFPGSIKIIISSVHRRAGLLYDKYAANFGQDDDDTLVVLGTSLQFNSTLDKAEIDRQLALDPEKAGAEYLSRWRDDLTTFLDRLLVEAAIDKGIIIRPYQRSQTYTCFADPSGGRQDAFTAAIGHKEGDLVIVDAVFEKRAPFDADIALNEVSEFALSYGCRRVYGDAYGAELTVAAFRARGIDYRQLKADGFEARLNRSQIYLNSLALFTSGRVRLPDNPRLVHQLINLERRAARSGHDTIDHPRGGSDDLANSVAGVMVALADDPSAVWRKPWAGTSLPTGIPAGFGGSAVMYAQQRGPMHGTVGRFRQTQKEMELHQ